MRSDLFFLFIFFFVTEMQCLEPSFDVCEAIFVFFSEVELMVEYLYYRGLIF